jgi:uncharacterized protein YgiM (DUF1202 family)
MKPLFTIIFFMMAQASYGQIATANIDSEIARCTGSAYCRACKSCNYCKHCNSGGTCGVCSPSATKTTSKFKDHYVYVRNEKMNIRSGPGRHYDVVKNVPGDTELYIISYEDNGWVQVKYTYKVRGVEKSVEGYALKILLVDEKRN